MTDKLESGHTFEEFKGEEGELLKKRYLRSTTGMMRLHPGGWVVPTSFVKYSKLIYNFEVMPTDVFVMSFPKSGSTWIQEITWNLLHNPNLDNPQANTPSEERFRVLEGDMIVGKTGVPAIAEFPKFLKKFEMLYPGRHCSEGICLLLAAHLPSPRVIKSHLDLSLLPSKLLESKVIYVARDPRDVITSFYHYLRLHTLMGLKGTLDEFVEDVVNDRIVFSPYWSHLKSAWEQRNHPNFCLVFYEDLKTDTVSEVKRIDNFLGTNRSEKQIQNVLHCTSFAELKEKDKASDFNSLFNEEVMKKEGGFFRKGEIGDWKNRFSPEQVEKLNAWMEKNLPQFGENFKYKI